jgi:uncharacterized RDD family membrane protein YckC
MVYAGFWLRLVAMVIDVLLLALVNTLLNPHFTEVVQNGQWMMLYQEQSQGVVGISILIRWLYFTLMESSSSQATLGKMALGLIVTNEQGERIGFGRANARFWSKIVSAIILLIGFIMVAFTSRKQGLHDLIARTLVLKK